MNLVSPLTSVEKAKAQTFGMVAAVTNWCKFSKNRSGGKILNKNVKDVMAIVNTKIGLLPVSAL